MREDRDGAKTTVRCSSRKARALESLGDVLLARGLLSEAGRQERKNPSGFCYTLKSHSRGLAPRDAALYSWSKVASQLLYSHDDYPDYQLKCYRSNPIFRDRFLYPSGCAGIPMPNDKFVNAYLYMFAT